MLERKQKGARQISILAVLWPYSGRFILAWRQDEGCNHGDEPAYHHRKRDDQDSARWQGRADFNRLTKGLIERAAVLAVHLTRPHQQIDIGLIKLVQLHLRGRDQLTREINPVINLLGLDVEIRPLSDKFTLGLIELGQIFRQGGAVDQFHDITNGITRDLHPVRLIARPIHGLGRLSIDHQLDRHDGFVHAPNFLIYLFDFQEKILLIEFCQRIIGTEVPAQDRAQVDIVEIDDPRLQIRRRDACIRLDCAEPAVLLKNIHRSDHHLNIITRLQHADGGIEAQRRRL